MPALARPRYEAFAQAILSGLSSPDHFLTQGQAYNKAGYRAKDAGIKGGSAEAAASQLLKKIKPIMERVRELQAQQLARLQPKIDLSKERVGKRLALASEMAERLDNPSAIATSEMGIAKVFGHLVEKHEHHLSTDYSQAKTDIDIGTQLLQQVGFASPDASSVAKAIEANALFVEQLIAIRDQATATLELAAT